MARRNASESPAKAPLPRKPSTTVEEPDEFAVWGERGRRAALGLTALLIASRPYWPSEDAAASIPGLTWVLAVTVAFALAVVSSIVGGVFRLRFSWTDAAVVALALLVGVSAGQGADHRAAVNSAWNWAGVALLYVLARVLPRNRSETSALAAVLVASAVSVAAYGVYQAFVEYPEMRKSYYAHKSQVLRAVGIRPGSVQEYLYEQRLNSNEPMSTFALTNSLAGFIVGPLVVSLGLVGAALGGRKGKAAGRFDSGAFTSIAIALPPIAALLICLMLTMSRSAYIGLAVALLVLAWRLTRSVPRKTLLIGACVLALVLAGVVAGGVAAGKLDKLVLLQSTKSMRYRAEYWTGAWRLIRESPSVFWRGVGPGNFGSHYLRHKLETSSEDVKDPHDMFLEVWACSGLPAMLCLIGALALGIRTTLVGTGAIDEPKVEPAPRPPDFRSSKATYNDSYINGARVDPTTPPRSATWVVLCGGASWLAVVLLGWVDPIDASSQAASARWYLLGIAWCLTVVFGAPLWRGVGGPPAWAFGAGALAIAVNLIAAGGISMPSVALSLWMLIALGLNTQEDPRQGNLREYPGRTLPFLGGVVAAILLGLFYRDVMPYLRSQTLVGRARDLMSRETPAFDAARTSLFHAISADPYDLAPWYALADLEYQYWLSRGAKAGEPMWKEVDVALLKALDNPRDPRTLGVQLQRAGYAREILARRSADFSALEIIKLRGTIVNAMRNATISHPTSALFHGELAEASADLGEYGGAVKAAKEALRLDKVTPHLDRKLPGALRKAAQGKHSHLGNPSPSVREAGSRGRRQG